MLRVEDFAEYFREVHGCDPFPWQRLLLQQISESGKWPATLDLPTGAGKTAAIDIAVFHLGLEAARGTSRRAPVRIAFVVDRRLVVDDAFERARKLEAALCKPPGPVSVRVAEALKSLALDGPPLMARRMRGGIPREHDWARTPSQPTILCSTVDQVGSRLLFRGYGVSDAMKPVHAGLIGSDCLILLDEAHLAEPFRQTLEWVGRYRGTAWRSSDYSAPWSIATLTATPGQEENVGFKLDQDAAEMDSEHPILKLRLQASKPARLIMVGGDEERQQVLDDEVAAALQAGARVVGVVVNRVARARRVFERLRSQFDPLEVDVLLLIGPARPVQRDLVASRLAPIRTGADRVLKLPLVVVATQCIEAGVDIDLDALLTEAAPLDALRQRFGRLNRAGRAIRPVAAIVATKDEVGARSTDPVYGQALREAWKTLLSNASKAGKKEQLVDFGIADFRVPMPPESLTPKPDAPVLMPAHLDLLSQTSPIPAADPDVALHLRGPTRQPDSVTVIWRADIRPEWRDQDAIRLLTLAVPRSAEAIELPLWSVKRWLACDTQSEDALADVVVSEPADSGSQRKSRPVFRWKGIDERSRWIASTDLHPGDTIVIPTSYGGVDEYGWHPDGGGHASDLADEASKPYWGRSFAVRVAPGLIGDGVSPEILSDVLASKRNEPWRAMCTALLTLALPDSLVERLRLLDQARTRRGRASVEVHLDLYGSGDDDEPRGVVFVAPRGLKEYVSAEDGQPNTTEDDASGSLYGFAQTLAEHSVEVEAKAEMFALAAGLPCERVVDLKLAGFLHDEGKRDPRFQRWLHYGDFLGADPDDEATILAKSGRGIPPAAWAKAGLPAHWRHEALSVRLARAHERLKGAHDADLVLWLVGTHHGHGRPFYPHADPSESASSPGPQSLAFDWNGMDWPTLFRTLKDRYGAWELARMEAIVRLADHRASEDAQAGRDGE